MQYCHFQSRQLFSRTFKTLLVTMFLLSEIIPTATKAVAADRAQLAAKKSAILLVGAASSLQDVLTALRQDFVEKHPEVDLQFNFAASSTIVRQIKAKAPIDVFFAADANNMDRLADAGLIVKSSRQNIVSNDLVLVVGKQVESGAVASPSDLKKDLIHNIATCDQAVPVGHYTHMLLDKLQLGKDLKSKLVKADNVRAALALVQSGTADAGFVYATDVTAQGHDVRVVYRVPGTELGINYPVAIIGQSRVPKLGKDFIEYLRGAPAARKTFEKFGFKD